MSNPMNHRRELQEAITLACQNFGVAVEFEDTNSNHRRCTIMHAGQRRVLHFANTSSDWRERANVLARTRRAIKQMELARWQRFTIVDAIENGLRPDRRQQDQNRRMNGLGFTCDTDTEIANERDPAEANQRRREFERERLHEKHMERLRAAREQS